MENVTTPDRAELVLTPTAPFAFRHTLTRLRGMRSSPVVRTFRPASVCFALQIRGRPLRVTLDDVGSERAPALRCTLAASRLDDDLVAAAEDRVRFHLGLDDDLAAFHAAARDDDAFSPVLEALHGYHLTRYTTPFESAVWAVVQQRTPNGFAFGTMATLTDLLGDAVVVDGTRYTTFPEPASFAYDARDALLRATNNTRKTDRLVPLGRAFATVDEDFLRTAPYDDVARWLGLVPGIGPWSIEYVMLRGLGRVERTPWTDTGLLDAISAVYTRGFAISRGSARELAESYGWYQGLWAHYLKCYVYAQPRG